MTTALVVGATVRPNPAPNKASWMANAAYDVSAFQVAPIHAKAAVDNTNPTSSGGRYQVRSVIRPPMYEARAIAAVSDDMIHPATTAERLRSTSMAFTNKGTSTMVITSPAPTMKFTASATWRFRLRNKPGLSKGSAALRSCQMNATRPNTATPYNQRVSVPPPVRSWSPLTLWISAEPRRATLSDTSVVVSSNAPSQSIERRTGGRSCPSSAHHEAARPIAASGMFSQNCHCQERNRTSMAPYSGPHTQPIVSIAPSVPRARARSRTG